MKTRNYEVIAKKDLLHGAMAEKGFQTLLKNETV